jgi:transcriptional regulator with XRE-family HTH domain
MNEQLPDAKANVPTPEQLVGRLVRQLRQGRGWSQQEVAEKMRAYGYQWSQATVTRLESASRPIRVNELADLAMLFEVHVTQFLNPEKSVVWDDLDGLEREIEELSAKRVAVREHLDNQIALAEEAARGRAALAANLAQIDRRLEILAQWVPRFQEIARGRARNGDRSEPAQP